MGKAGAEASLDNALSECRHFGLTLLQAKSIAKEVAHVVNDWQPHFVSMGVSVRDVQTVAQHVDREALASQRALGSRL